MEKDTISFLLNVGKLKKTKRAGWLLKGISNPESVGEHSFRSAVMAMILAKPRGLDEVRLIKMALIHDIGEVLTNDIVWEHGKISDAEKQASKHKKEVNAVKEIFSGLTEGGSYLELVEDYLNQTSKEARFMKEIDKLEMAIQALEYKDKAEHSLEEFWENTEQYLKDKELIAIFEQLKKMKNSR